MRGTQRSFSSGGHFLVGDWLFFLSCFFVFYLPSGWTRRPVSDSVSPFFFFEFFVSMPRLLRLFPSGFWRTWVFCRRFFYLGGGSVCRGDSPLNRT